MKHDLVTDVLHAIRQVTGDRQGFVALHEPSFGRRERELVLDCIDSGFVSSVGNYVDLFEQRLANFLGVKYAVAVVNGTAALHVALLLAGVRRNDEVFVPSLSFVATANAVTYCGAIPHFVDSAPDTLGIDPVSLSGYLEEILIQKDNTWFNRRTGRRVSVIVPMHVFGHPVHMDALLEVAARFDLQVVEDAAESLGSSYKCRMTGTLTGLSAFSFNGNKVITTGGGGAIVTDNQELAKKAKHITTTAKIPHQWAFAHDQIGFNYRMPNLNAALGCAQLDALPDFIVKKRALAKSYETAFSGISGVSFVSEPAHSHSNYWLNALLLDDAMASQRDQILAVTNDAGYMTRPVWQLLHTLPIYADNPAMLMPIAESLEKRLLNIPSSPFLITGA